MPILWRYLLLGYCRFFSLSVCSFVMILMISRFKEIARFAALSANFAKTWFFIAYQIPLILPLAIPISAFIASLMLFQSMSKSKELTAMRASGICLKTVLSPILLLSICLSISNFIICGNITPVCRRASKELIYNETSNNPLLLLQRQNLVKIKKSYLKMDMDGEKAKDFFLITYNPSNERLSLLTAKNLSVSQNELSGDGLALITHLKSETDYDPLILENLTTMSTEASTLSSSLKKNRPKLETSSLEFPLLRLSCKKNAVIEIFRRISLSIAVFTFTILGCCFGIEQGRSLSKKNLLISVSIGLAFMLSYLLAKELKSPWLTFSLFFFPHPIIWFVSIRKGLLA